MSGPVRTLQKRILKRRGFVRQTERVVPGNAALGIPPRLVRCRPGEGEIIGPDQKSVGRRWPMLLTRDGEVPVAALTNKGRPRGSRRGKPSTRRVAA